jgi:DNA-binding beta-propeller fold protein YncE
MKRGIIFSLFMALILLVSCSAPKAQEVTVVFAGGSPYGLYVDSSGTLFICDGYEKAIWRTASGETSLAAGNTEVRDHRGAVVAGYHDDELSAAVFASPWDIVPFLNGYLVSDPDNNVVRYFDDTQVETAVGQKEAGYLDGFGIQTLFSYPTGLAEGPEGGVYIADTGNHAIRYLSKEGHVTTLLGGTAGFADGMVSDSMLRRPTGLCYADGVLYIADTGNRRVCAYENGELRTLAGEGTNTEGDDNSTIFTAPYDIAVDENGNIYVADTANSAIYVIKNDTVKVFASMSETPEVYTGPVSPSGLYCIGDKLYASDSYTGVVAVYNLTE